MIVDVETHYLLTGIVGGHLSMEHHNLTLKKGVILILQKEERIDAERKCDDSYRRRKELMQKGSDA